MLDSHVLSMPHALSFQRPPLLSNGNSIFRCFFMCWCFKAMFQDASLNTLLIIYNLVYKHIKGGVNRDFWPMRPPEWVFGPPRCASGAWWLRFLLNHTYYYTYIYIHIWVVHNIYIYTMYIEHIICLYILYIHIYTYTLHFVSIYLLRVYIYICCFILYLYTTDANDDFTVWWTIYLTCDCYRWKWPILCMTCRISYGTQNMFPIYPLVI